MPTLKENIDKWLGPELTQPGTQQWDIAHTWIEISRMKESIETDPILRCLANRIYYETDGYNCSHYVLREVAKALLLRNFTTTLVGDSHQTNWYQVTEEARTRMRAGAARMTTAERQKGLCWTEHGISFN